MFIIVDNTFILNFLFFYLDITMNGLIYKLYCKDNEVEDCYIGSTFNLNVRIQRHKNRCLNPRDKKTHFKVYDFIRNNGGWYNFSFEVLEVVENVNTKEDLTEREKYWIYELKPTLNQRIPNRSYKEYYNDNRESILKKRRENYRLQKNLCNKL